MLSSHKIHIHKAQLSSHEIHIHNAQLSSQEIHIHKPQFSNQRYPTIDIWLLLFPGCCFIRCIQQKWLAIWRLALGFFLFSPFHCMLLFFCWFIFTLYCMFSSWALLTFLIFYYMLALDLDLVFLGLHLTRFHWLWCVKFLWLCFIFCQLY